MENTTLLGLESKMTNFSFDIYNPKDDSTQQKNIASYEGKRLVLLFYPADFTFVCPTELKDLNKSYADLQASNAEVVVISTDTVFSHKRRVETEHLLEGFTIPMASDRKGEISKALGIRNIQSGNSERGTFIISPDGIIKSIEIVTEPIGRSSNELVRKVKALEFIRANPGQACPASRNQGEKTLTPSIKIAGNIADQLK